MIYYECHITMKPVELNQVPLYEKLCKEKKFKIATLLMQKGTKLIHSDLDSFCTGRDKSFKALELRMKDLLHNLKEYGFIIKRYKIEGIVKDSKRKDYLGIL